MFNYSIRRVLYLIPTLFGITLVTFLVISLAPGDPVSLQQSGLMNANFSQKAYDDMRRLYGLDKPLHVRYFIWLDRFVRFDFGNSFSDNRPVTEKIMEKLPATLVLNIISMFLTISIAVPAGILSAMKHKSVYDKISGLIFYMLYSLPNFWLALLLITLLGLKLDLLPIYGIESDQSATLTFFPWLWDRILHLILPVTCLTLGGFAYLSRFCRGILLEVIRQDYIRTAWAKGLNKRTVILKHAFRNALIPLVTLFALMVPLLVSGSVILEYIFNWPGIGQLYFNAIMSRDYPTIMGLSVISAILVLISNLLADLLYALIDPRIMYK
ncbi:ABC transporter permease [candidate division CSSED10-310 bacterium]|uniref:ABC transporter permease n=1 Tax=candidate division CSSED10-310 bacterium TaxID=2855610 RepID=A0ABV6YXV1_UNCC1